MNHIHFDHYHTAYSFTVSAMASLLLVPDSQGCHHRPCLDLVPKLARRYRILGHVT